MMKAPESSDGVFSVACEIARTDAKRPHVVIVGSGASLAAFPNGDRNGKRLPIMRDFACTLELETLLDSNGIPPPYEDFEGLYTVITRNPDKKELARTIEQRIDEYFSSLELPDTPTLYDHLVLALRPKDVIATFNWDPFLWRASERNAHFAKPPRLIYLHGNVAIGFCSEHRIKGQRNGKCPCCGKTFQASRLLYPVAQKNYNSDGFLSAEWEGLKQALRSAFALTVFGYGAPKTDIEAINLMRFAWGKPEGRELEETEIIDIKSEESLVQAWSDFIHTHHYRIHSCFYDSLMARHPRRTCEALWACLMECQFLEGENFPRQVLFDELYRWLRPRIGAERIAQ